VKFLIFFKKFYKVHSVEVLSQDPVNKNNSSSFMITNMELRFEPMCGQLDLELRCKTPKKREDHLIFFNFGIKKFILKSTQKKKTFTFECYNLLDFME
jgi:hypothetical protein